MSEGIVIWPLAIMGSKNGSFLMGRSETRGCTMHILILLAFLLVLMASPAWAESEAERIKKKVTSTIEIRQDTQKREDEWVSEKTGLEAQYQSLMDRNKYLQKHEIRTKETRNSQKAHILELERKLVESARLKEELSSNLDNVVEKLGEWIEHDLPFLPKERSDRLSSLKRMMADPGIQSGERFRRIMEGLQVETEYGGTVEVYQESIDLDGRPVLVDIFRLGRLSLFYQTPDGKQVGHYDRVEGKWKPLPNRYRRNINQAVEMAGRRRSIELIRLPVGRIEP